MASKVNVKFVVLLSVVLVAIAGATGALALKVVFKSADDLAARGDSAFAEGDFKAAEVYYSKAVNKDPYNEGYLLKWRGALEKWVPETDRELQTEFGSTYLALHNQLALSSNMSNVKFQQEQLDLMAATLEMQGFSRQAWENLATTCDRYIQTQQTLKPNDPSWIGLRRSRGLAWSRIATARLEISQEQRDLADADLVASLEADPADYEALEALVATRRDAAARAEQAGRQTEADRMQAEIEAMLRAFIERNGPGSVPSAQASMQLTQITLSADANRITAELGSGALPRLQELQNEYQKRTAEIAGSLMRAPVEQVGVRPLRRLIALESQTNIAQDYAAAMPVLDRCLAAAPDDAGLILLKAAVMTERKEYDGAIALLDGVLKRDRLPLGLAGVTLINRKIEASLRGANVAVRAASEAADQAGRDAWLARARDSRLDLVQRVPETATPVQLLDAKIAALAEDYYTAQRILDMYNQTTANADAEALWLAANVAIKLRQLGNAEAALERILALDPSNSAAHVALCDAEVELGRLDSAREHLQQAIKSRPQDAVLLRKLSEIEAKLGLTQPDDPIDAAIFEAQRLAGGSESEIADSAAGIERLRRALTELGPHPKLFAELARFLLISDNPEEAAEIAAQGIEQFPDDAYLKQVSQWVTSMSSVDEFIKSIMASNQPEVDKQLAIYAALERADRDEEAVAALKQAEAADPKHPLVLELLFSRAFAANDIAEATKLAERAKAADADRMEGLGYRARVLLLEGKDEEALAALNQAVQRSPNNASLWRLLAELQLQMERPGDALVSFQKALSIRPNDLKTVIDYCQGLIGMNRLDEALDYARRAEVTGRTDPRFMNLLLDLEARVGNKPGARDRREKILAARPDDLRNRIALADLYISLGQWDQARTLIDETRSKSGESDPLVTLDARLFAERNQMENARRVFAKRIAETPPTERISAYVALARFMLEHGRATPATIALQQAAALQKPGDHSVDALLADTLMNYGRDADAAVVLRRIIKAGADKEFAFTKRLAECLIRLDRLTEAEQLLASIPGGDADPTVVLLRAQAAIKRGDSKLARQITDDAVAKWPEDYRVWLMRADAEGAVPELRQDALADLQHAIEMRPDLGEAYRRKAELLAEMERFDEAIIAWRDAVRANPAAETLRSALLGTMVQRRMENEAVQMANEWFALHPQDVGLRSRVAELFVQGGMPIPAIHIYQEAFAIEQQPQLVLRLADLLIGAEPPRLADAERVLNDAKTIVPGDPSLLLARARVFALTNRLPAAHNDCIASFRLMNKEADPMTIWYSTMTRVFADSSQILSFLRQLSQEQGATEWVALFGARVMLSDPATATQGLAELEAVVTRTRDPKVRYSALRALAGNRYNAKRFEEALDLWKQALEFEPEDWQLENNIAYTLASDLSRPADALPYAEAATQHAPNNPETHDTLGTVYLGLGRASDAVAPLEAAVRASRGTPDDAKYMVRLAQARLESGDKQGASDLLLEVQGLLDKGRKLDDQYGAILTRIRQALGQN